jgi:hypothetical protein
MRGFGEHRRAKIWLSGVSECERSEARRALCLIQIQTQLPGLVPFHISNANQTRSAYRRVRCWFLIPLFHFSLFRAERPEGEAQNH